MTDSTSDSPSKYWGDDHYQIAEGLKDRVFFDEAIKRYEESIRHNPLNPNP